MSTVFDGERTKLTQNMIHLYRTWTNHPKNILCKQMDDYYTEAMNNMNVHVEFFKKDENNPNESDVFDGTRVLSIDDLLFQNPLTIVEHDYKDKDRWKIYSDQKSIYTFIPENVKHTEFENWTFQMIEEHVQNGKGCSFDICGYHCSTNPVKYNEFSILQHFISTLTEDDLYFGSAFVATFHLEWYLFLRDRFQCSTPKNIENGLLHYYESNLEKGILKHEYDLGVYNPKGEHDLQIRYQKVTPGYSLCTFEKSKEIVTILREKYPYNFDLKKLNYVFSVHVENKNFKIHGFNEFKGSEIILWFQITDDHEDYDVQYEQDLRSAASQREDLPKEAFQRKDLPKEAFQRKDLPKEASQREDLPKEAFQRKDVYLKFEKLRYKPIYGDSYSESYDDDE